MSKTAATHNSLLERLSSEEQVQIIQHCELVELAFGEVICEPEEAYQHVYFPLTAYIALLELVAEHPPLEICSIGSEGMLGVSLILGLQEVPLRAVVQGPGTAYKMPVDKFQEEFNSKPALQQTLNTYLFVTIAQLSQTAACSRFHEVEARLAHWLLLIQDRAHANCFHLTHQYLANMLGVQRSAVTIAAGSLQEQKLISYSRGKISILDRPGLIKESCECYVAVNYDYKKQFI